MADPEVKPSAVRVGGLPYRVNSDEAAASAVRAGGSAISEQEAQTAQKAQNDLSYVDKNWGGTAGNLAIGVGLGGLSLGLGPGFAVKSGLVDAGHMQASQAGLAYQTGDVIGTLLPALLTGGEAFGARSGIGKALSMTPAGLMEMGGAALEKRIAGSVLAEQAGMLGRMASAPAKMAARGAFEGAAINLGHTTGDALIQNKPLSSEALLASGIDGALAGGLIGGTLGSVGSIAGRAVESVGAYGKGIIGSTGQKAGAVYRRLGTSAGEIAESEALHGGTKGFLTKVGEVLDDGGTGARIGSPDKELLGGLISSKKVYTNALNEVVSDLESQGGMYKPDANRILKRWDAEVLAPNVGTMNYERVNTIVQEMKDELGQITTTKRSLEGMTERERLTQPLTADRVPTWKEWITSRAQLSERLKDAIGVHSADPTLSIGQKLRTNLLDVLDSEIRSSMEAASASPGLGGISEKYAAASTKLKIAEQLEESLGKRQADMMLKTEASITPRDVGTFVGMSAIGHPIAGLGWLAAKGVGRKLEAKLSPAMAQMAFDSSVGTKAAAATQNVTGNISKTIARVFSAAGKSPAKAVQAVRAQSQRTNPDRAHYEDTATRTEQLLSANHQDNLRRYAEMLHSQGYNEFASSLMETNNRAVQYLINNNPKRSSAGAMRSLRPHAISKSLSMEEHKFLRIQRGVSGGPLALLKDLEDGTLSRDQVRAVKYVYPEVHKEIVTQVSTQIYEMKVAGKFLPMTTIAKIGLVLDAPVDSTLTPEFVAGIQATMNKKPEGRPPGPSPTGSLNPTELYTPLQKINA